MKTVFLFTIAMACQLAALAQQPDIQYKTKKTTRTYSVDADEAAVVASQKDGKMIEDLLKKRFRALGKLDAKDIAACYDASPVYVSGEKFTTISAYLAQSMPMFNGKLEVGNHHLKYEMQDVGFATAEETYDYTYTAKDGTTVKGSALATYVVKKRNNQWIIIQNHLSFKRA